MESEAPETLDAGDRRRRIPVSLKDPATLRALIDTLAEGTYVANPDGRILDANPAFMDMVGAKTLEELQEHAMGDLWPETERRADFVSEVIARGTVTEFELDVKRLDGELVSVLDTCHAQEENGEVVALYGVLLDITKRKTLEAQLAQLSVRDPLTGCYNRRYLQAQRPVLERPSYFYGCLMMDLDDFKAINDTYGHEEGDRVLQRFAHFIIRNKRADDILVRIGGDEFALFVEVVRPENMDLISSRLVENAPTQAPIAFSIGHAYRKPSETLEQILARADAAMYEAKGRHSEDRGQRQDREETPDAEESSVT
jgi:diguanylate cyclase (GGDEF)-like protein/PAS domain S-box-containing protein